MRRAAPIALSLLAIAIAGCSGELGGEDLPWPPPNSRALDRQVEALEPGMSAGEIEDALGEPALERTIEPEGEPPVEILFYGRWQLQLEDGALTQRIKWVLERPLDRSIPQLDRRILDLELGASITAIKSMLGPPDTYEIWSNAPEKEEFLTYEWWELTFINGALAHRQQQ